MQSPAFETFSQTMKEALDKFYAFAGDNLNEENVNQFVNRMYFRFDDSEFTHEFCVQAILNKTFHTVIVKENFCLKIFEAWEKLINASTKKESNSKVSIQIGDESPEIKKTHLNVDFVSDTQKQIKILNENLSVMNPDVETPFVALKLYSSSPSETKDFLDGMLQMFEPLLQSAPIFIIPEIEVIGGSDHVIVKVSSSKSLELAFLTIVFGHLLAKLPEYDLEFKLNLQTGTNFKHLISNHSDNTAFDLLNGFKVNLEFKNNLAGFIDLFSELLKSKENYKGYGSAKWLSFILGSVSLNSELKVNLGDNEVELLSNLPKVNIFDKEGLLSQTPIGAAKSMRDENEIAQMVLPNLTNLEGKAELFVNTPFFTVKGELDVSGVLELINHIVDLYGA